MALAVAPDAGFWEGRVYKLREFKCSPATGSSKGVSFAQTMSHMKLRYVLKPEVASFGEADFTVEMSSWELKVKVEGKPELDAHLTALNGALCADIRRDLSWWAIEKEANGSTVFVAKLAKKEHKAWTTVWKMGTSQQRKNHFAWNTSQKAQIKKAEEVAFKVKPGKPGEKDSFFISREAVCAALEDGQDEQTAIIRIHFDKQALEKACESVCLGNLFALDVMERFLKVYIRGDERSPIMLGELQGKVIPEKTKWEIVKAVAPPEPEEQGQPIQPQKPALRPHQQGQKLGQANVPQYVSCLQVTLTKAKPSSKPWPKIINENVLALERESAPMIEELQAKAVTRAPSPDRTNWTPQDHTKENKAKGDNCFKNGEWRDGSVFYTRAINNTPEDHKLYSNRSACYAKLKKWDKALKDAEKCISLNSSWPKAYFRQGQALRGLQRWEDAINSFKEGRFREPKNPDWAKEIDKTEDERDKWDEEMREMRRLKREADMTTELNEATVVAEREAMITVAEQAMKAGKTRKEAGELAMKGAELAKQRVHEMANQKKKAMMVEDDKEIDEPTPYRIVKEDGSIHPKGFAHTDKGMYFMGMVLMNADREPANQPWVEVRHPGRLRWSQGCAQLRLKVTLPPSIKNASELEVRLTSTSLFIGTYGDTDPIIIGDFERKVDPEGENYSWFLVPEEHPPILEMCLDKDPAEVYQTFSYGTLLWSRLFTDDVPLGEGLFEADLTDLPPQLLEKFRKEQADANQRSVDERNRRKKMTEEEIMEETARNWNDEFGRHNMPHRLDTNEDKMIESMKYGQK